MLSHRELWLVLGVMVLLNELEIKKLVLFLYIFTYLGI